MNRLLFVALTTFCALAAFTASAQSADIAAIKQLNADWIHNYMVKDSTTWNRIFADDFFLINPAGRKFTKQEILHLPPQSFVSTKVDTVDVQLHGNIGLVMATCSFVTLTDGKESTGRTNYLDVYEKRKGRWVAIAAHVTWLGEVK